MSVLADRFRREGLADAVIILVARRVHPATTAEEWGRILGLQQRDIIAAVERFRERRMLPPRPVRALPPERHGNKGRTVATLAERRERDSLIRRMRAQGATTFEIAEATGLGPNRVRQVLRGKETSL